MLVIIEGTRLGKIFRITDNNSLYLAGVFRKTNENELQYIKPTHLPHSLLF